MNPCGFQLTTDWLWVWPDIYWLTPHDTYLVFVVSFYVTYSLLFTVFFAFCSAVCPAPVIPSGDTSSRSRSWMMLRRKLRRSRRSLSQGAMLCTDDVSERDEREKAGTLDLTHPLHHSTYELLDTPDPSDINLNHIDTSHNSMQGLDDSMEFSDLSLTSREVSIVSVTSPKSGKDTSLSTSRISLIGGLKQRLRWRQRGRGKYRSHSPYYTRGGGFHPQILILILIPSPRLLHAMW